jgi:acyl-CoA synthetase (AMP-forming)/AMP-acid ligase II
MIDDGGFLHFLGRRKEMLKVNGMSVFPSEIEVLLSGHPDVAGSGVLGAADPRKGELPLTATGKVKKHIRDELLEPAAS